MSIIVDVFIEVPKYSNLKYKYDNKTKNTIVERELNYHLLYPFNYGYIKNTLNADGMEIDCILIMDEKLPPGTVIKCKIIGGFKYSDEKGIDNKLIVSPLYSKYNCLSDLSMETKNKIMYFFENYKNNLKIKTNFYTFLNRKDSNTFYNDNKVEPSIIGQIWNRILGY